MAGIWFGVNGVSRKVKTPWLEVNNVARKCKGGWKGIANVARKFFSGCLISSVYVDPNDSQISQDNSSVTWTEGGTITCNGYEGSSAGGYKKYYIELEEPITVSSSVEYTATVTRSSGSADVLRGSVYYSTSSDFGSGNFQIGSAVIQTSTTKTETLKTTLTSSVIIYGFYIRLGYINSDESTSWLGNIVITSIKVDGEEILVI